MRLIISAPAKASTRPDHLPVKFFNSKPEIQILMILNGINTPGFKQRVKSVD
jgi:hypothetical protein